MKPNLSVRIDSKQAGVHISSPQHGFTLIEMIIVIAIVGIMSAIAIPAVNDWRNKSAVRGAAQSLMVHLKQARTLAFAENRSVSVTFTSTSYTFDADVSGSCGPCRNEQITFSQFSNNLSVSPTTTRTFTSRGTANSGTITLAASSHNKKITMNIIGRAYLQ